MKKGVIFVIIVLSLAVVSTIGLAGFGEPTSLLRGRVLSSVWEAIKAGTAMEPGAPLPEEPMEPSQR
jgi:hypothetical protein